MVTFSYLPPLPMRQKSGLPNPVTVAPAFRRRRTIWFLLTCIICSLFFFFSPVSLYPSSLFRSSPAEPTSLRRDALELHGLQHFVLNSDLSLHNVLYKANRDRPLGVPVHDHIRNAGKDDGDGVPDAEHGRLDPTKEISLKVYSSFNGDDDWAKHVRELQNNSPLVVFSKVRLQTVLSLYIIVCGRQMRMYIVPRRFIHPRGKALRSFFFLSVFVFISGEREADGLLTTPCISLPPGPPPYDSAWGHSKSYCPYSKRAKNLIQTYALDPPPRIIEADLRGKRGLCLVP